MNKVPQFSWLVAIPHVVFGEQSPFHQVAVPSIACGPPAADNHSILIYHAFVCTVFLREGSHLGRGMGLLPHV